MSAPAAVIAHTPLWVYGIFALLVQRGIAAARPNAVAPRRLFTLPLVLTVSGAVVLARAGTLLPVALAAALAGLAVGGALGWRLFAGIPGYRWDGGQLHRPGTWLMLGVSLVAFAMKFGLATAAGWHPELAAGVHGALLTGAVAGIASGLLWGATITQLLLGRGFAAGAPAASVPNQGFVE
jgi:hypothetical protein